MELAQRIGFFAPAYVLDEVSVDLPKQPSNVLETRIRGAIKAADAQYSPSREAIEEFANGRIDPDSIRRFTMRFGPLWTNRSDKKFCFRVLDWDAARQQFRWTWDRLLGLPTRDVDIPLVCKPIKETLQTKRDPILRVDVTGGQFELTADKGMIFAAQSLYQALLLKLLSMSEAGKLRRCARPDCDRLPYFVAEHGKQQYCCEQCAEWRQRQFKKAWWSKEGKRWREKRAKPGSDKGRRQKAKRGTSVVVNHKQKTK